MNKHVYMADGEINPNDNAAGDTQEEADDEMEVGIHQAMSYLGYVALHV